MKPYFFVWQSARTGLIFALFITALFFITGCGDDGSWSDSNSKLSVRMIGQMPEELAEEIDQQFVNAEFESDYPFLIGDVDLNTLSESERSVIEQTFKDDIPLALVRPTLERRQALLRLIGLEMTEISNDIPEFWGVQTSREYEIWGYAFDDPSPSQTTNTDITDYTNYPDVVTTNGSMEFSNLYDDPAYQLSRVEDLRKWLELAPERALGEMSDLAKATSTENNEDVNAFSDTPSQTDIAKVLLLDMAKAQFNYLHNNYTINLSARSVHQANNNYFVISAKGILTADKEWKETTTEAERTQPGMDNRGRVAHKYHIGFYIPNTLSYEVTEATKTYPATVEGEQEISKSFGWNLGGEVTGGAACAASSKDSGCEGKVGVKLTGGIKADVTTKFRVKDVKVENKSEDGHPAWVYTIQPPEIDTNYWVGRWISPVWTLPKELSTSTFQPQMSWVWKIDDSIRSKYPEGLPIIVEFQPQLIHCFTKYNGLTRAANEGYLRPELFSVQVSLPWPPKTATEQASQEKDGSSD